MSKNRMISNELMMALIKYHVLDMKDNEEINNLIISELEEKLSKMSRHEDYTACNINRVPVDNINTCK